MKKYLAILAVMVVISPTIVFAQNPPPTTPSTNPCALSRVNGTTTVPSTLPRCINQIYIWSLGLAVLLAFLMIIVGGYFYMTAGGNGEQASKGKEFITSALMGVVILFCAYLLLNEINPDLVNFNLKSLEGLNGQTTPTNPANPTPTPIRGDCTGELTTEPDGSTRCESGG